MENSNYKPTAETTESARETALKAIPKPIDDGIYIISLTHRLYVNVLTKEVWREGDWDGKDERIRLHEYSTAKDMWMHHEPLLKYEFPFAPYTPNDLPVLTSDCSYVRYVPNAVRVLPPYVWRKPPKV